MTSVTEFNLEQELKTLEQFEEWLNSKSSAEKVGLARTSTGCPSSNVSSKNDEGPDVGVDYVCAGESKVRHSRLSYHFIRWVDDGRSDEEPVTASQVKRALKDARLEVSAIDVPQSGVGNG